MKTLTALRAEIDAIDEQIIAMVGARFRITEQVGTLKAETKLAAVDADRERQKVKRFNQLAREHGVSPALVEGVFKLVMLEVVAKHRELARGT